MFCVRSLEKADLIAGIVGVLLWLEPVEDGDVAVGSGGPRVLGVDGRLLGGFDLAQAGVLQVERQVDQIAQVVVAADVRLVEHAVQVQLDGLQNIVEKWIDQSKPRSRTIDFGVAKHPIEDRAPTLELKNCRAIG